jgi:ABC-type multidrug transport system fused ATPase/permease subunit
MNLALLLSPTPASQDLVNGVVVPIIVLAVALYGFLSFLRLPKMFALLASLALIGFAYVSGLILSFSSLILSLGSLASTGVYIALFLLGASLASRSKGIKRKAVRYVDVKRMNRRQLSQEMTNIEKRMIELQNRLEKVKIQEHNLELQFANDKSSQVLKELEKVRKLKNELSDALDMLIERREACKRAYREATV